MKHRRQTVVVWLSIYALFTVDAADAGPLRDFFKTLRSAIAQPKETPRPHRSTHKRRKNPPHEVPNSETSDKQMPASSGQPDVRWAKAGSVATEQKAKLPYGTPVPGKPGFSHQPVRAGCGLCASTRFPAGNPSRRSLHRQHFPNTIVSVPNKVSHREDAECEITF